MDFGADGEIPGRRPSAGGCRAGSEHDHPVGVLQREIGAAVAVNADLPEKSRRCMVEVGQARPARHAWSRSCAANRERHPRRPRGLCRRPRARYGRVPPSSVSEIAEAASAGASASASANSGKTISPPTSACCTSIGTSISTGPIRPARAVAYAFASSRRSSSPLATSTASLVMGRTISTKFGFPGSLIDARRRHDRRCFLCCAPGR